MKSAVRRVLLLSALMSPNALFALGLGEIHLKSALNQPFDADIDLVSAADEDLSALRAALASSDTFARYGLDKPAYLADFTFRVVRGPDGRDVLKVTSPRPVTEPFVTLLVEANWPRGRLLREYTVLLDPPVYAPSAPAVAPVAAPRVSTPAPVPAAPAAVESPGGTPEAFASAPAAPRPAPAPERARAAVPVAAPSVAAGSSYRVRPNDTLWNIASAAHPGTRSDVNRAMVAIYQSNPQAFAGNINVLKAGSLLTIPSASDVSTIPAAAAAAEVARQYRMWREGVPAVEGPEASAGRLRLVTPEQGTPAASTSTTPPASAAGGGDAALQSRVQQLEAELAEAKRLLEVRNAELATLQRQAVPAPGGVPAEGAAPVAPGGAVVQPEVTPPSAEGTPVAEAPAAPAEAAPAPKAEPTPDKPKKVAKPPPEPSMLERLMNYWWVLLGLLAAALAYLFYKRTRGESTAEQDLQEAMARTTTDLRGKLAARSREADIVVEERRPAEPAPAPRAVAAAAAAAAGAAPRAPEPGRKPAAVEDTLSGDGPVSIEAGDPLAEADFHMAYGLYDQAADLVQLAIKREPLRRDLKLKLLEIFFVWGNRDRFLELAREMRDSHRDAQAGEWDKILIMGKQLAPEDPLFAGPARATPAELDMELHSSEGPLDMDLGDDFGSTTGTDIDLTATSALAPGEAGLDFVIDEPERGADDASALAPTVETPRLRARLSSEDPTEEVPIDELGIEVAGLEGLGELDDVETVEVSRPQALVEDTVESPRPPRPAADEEGDDMLSSTGILKEQTGILRALEQGQAVDYDLSEVTGEMPTIEAKAVSSAGAVDFALGEEAATMSEVGTKLDLARAYIDMGDPEGARSILEEVLKEGSAVQKQEAERLVASLP
jgi:pilus assembly protein FimV